MGVNRVWKYYNLILQQTAYEILESALRAEGDKSARVNKVKGELQKMPFSQAFRPYSFLGRRVFEGLKYSIPQEDDGIPSRVAKFTGIKSKISGEKLEREALEATRLNMALFEAAFDSQ